jgi:hypothetical protein
VESSHTSPALAVQDAVVVTDELAVVVSEELAVVVTEELAVVVADDELQAPLVQVSPVAQDPVY